MVQFEEQTGHAQHTGHGSADLVAHVSQEFVLRLIRRFRRLFGSPQVFRALRPPTLPPHAEGHQTEGEQAVENLGPEALPGRRPYANGQGGAGLVPYAVPIGTFDAQDVASWIEVREVHPTGRTVLDPAFPQALHVVAEAIAGRGGVVEHGELEGHQIVLMPEFQFF